MDELRRRFGGYRQGGVGRELGRGEGSGRRVQTGHRGLVARCLQPMRHGVPVSRCLGAGIPTGYSSSSGLPLEDAAANR